MSYIFLPRTESRNYELIRAAKLEIISGSVWFNLATSSQNSDFEESMHWQFGFQLARIPSKMAWRSPLPPSNSGSTRTCALKSLRKKPDLGSIANRPALSCAPLCRAYSPIGRIFHISRRPLRPCDAAKNDERAQFARQNRPPRLAAAALAARAGWSSQVGTETERSTHLADESGT